MTLRLYNTLTRKKETFAPFTPGKVGIYVCGITAWDSTHLGHGRAAVVFDTLVRYLRARGLTVTYVRNYTDVDDKIINRANKEKIGWAAIAEKYIGEYAAEMAALGNIPPDLEPRASEHIPGMIAAIEGLIRAGKAYAVGGDVFYAIRSFPAYGKLSGKKIEELEVGARVEPNETKRDPLDFALWKASKPGEPTWESPWGPGRPGWHIECSVMSTHYLGQPFDIHGGGRDLIFPHHENEIAQAEGASDKPFVRCWMHNGALTINNEKMSKSLGNFFKTGEALKRFDPEALRYFLLSSHYRSPLDFSEQAISECAQALDRFYETTTRLGISASENKEVAPAASPSKGGEGEGEKRAIKAVQTLADKIEEVLADDLNTTKALAAIFETIRDLNRYLDGQPGHPEIHRWLQDAWQRQRAALHQLLGIFGSNPNAFRERCSRLVQATRGVDPAEVERLIAERAKARKAKDFAAGDAIRARLDVLGVTVKDLPDGTTEWKVR
ncbi:MAG: cysteine--tRNA ligase [Deltaproteobacteria bacterium]|nr:cysteine--tRNA ligase [Deltaproteobacteria bacterium]